MTLRQVDRPLRKDVRFLGELLGSVIAEQEGYDLLELEDRIASALEERDRSSLTPAEQHEMTLRIREEITALWQTDELRRERPTVGDEVKNVLWYIEEILWDALPRLSQQLSEAFEAAYGE